MIRSACIAIARASSSRRAWAGQMACLNRSGPTPDYAAWPELRWDTALPAAADVVILSVRPQDFRSGSWRCPDALVISLMAGVPSGEIAARTGSDRIVRAMPNAAVEIGRSYAPWVAGEAVTAKDKEIAARILGATGGEDEIDSEDQLDVLTALAGSGPAWSALLANALSTAALRAGLRGGGNGRQPLLLSRSLRVERPCLQGGEAGQRGPSPQASQVASRWHLALPCPEIARLPGETTPPGPRRKSPGPNC
ncbi:pyrroline-5-carboxylate reductase family protein [Mangrovicoccus ximenensis]|uniref:pyrroline-5-carboxylate reductase family protein n=1 Tax=Mangrovicoccus ximenensis TaxID=1911570 RepID=UPI000D3C829B|nr:pyrroline-5-carboxylate reductase dimerization domain-containing protein [Mangrovicoccus ximenensis]